MSTCTDKAGSIIDVDCIYEDGKFIIGGTSCCLPEIFTVRFRAPTDYKAGDVIVFREKELPVRTPGMESASSDAFRTGAIVHADIDMVSQRAFVWLGSAGGGLVLPDFSYEEQFTGQRWVNGKKIYVRVVEFSLIGENDSVPHNIANIEDIVNFEVVVSDISENDGETMYFKAINMQNSATIQFRQVIISKTHIRCAIRRATTYINNVGKVILYYTCTDR